MLMLIINTLAISIEIGTSLKPYALFTNDNIFSNPKNTFVDNVIIILKLK